jgi:hypothetical protein
MNIKNIILFSFLFMVLAGLTLSTVSAVKVPTKYKTHTCINKYYESGCKYEYDTGMYAWNPSTGVTIIIVSLTQRSVKNIVEVKQNLNIISIITMVNTNGQMLKSLN